MTSSVPERQHNNTTIKQLSNYSDHLRSFFFILFFFLFITSLYSQTVYEPIQSGVYDFLERMAQKGIIEFNDEIRPVSREYIAEKLLKIKNEKLKFASLTGLEEEELQFYLKDFGIELKFKSKRNEISGIIKKVFNTVDLVASPGNDTTTFLSEDPYGRFRFFAYEDPLFKINVIPILGYSRGTWGGAKYSHTWSGLAFYGYLGDNIGFSFSYRDNTESGAHIDSAKSFTPETGVIVAKYSANKIEYSNVNAVLSFNWNWGDISIGKDYFEWGYGRSGNIVLSDKAPSFPFLRLDIQPVKWLRFNYIHAVLNSKIIDSTSIYPTQSQWEREQYRSKYYASHTLTVIPSKGTEISLGESIIYSDRFEPIYLIPVMFFRLADHYSSNADIKTGSNSQFFLGVSSRNLVKNTHLYGSLFIDELTLEGLFNPAKQKNQFGFMLGSSVTDLPIDNLTMTIEFTKIFPFVYSNWLPTQTYTSSGYNMGDWMGSNADRIYGSINYRFTRGLQASLWGEFIRKGEPGTTIQEYNIPQPPFLFGKRTNYIFWGGNINYEIVHDLFADLHYRKLSTKDISTNITNDSDEFYLSVYYGIR